MRYFLMVVFGIVLIVTQIGVLIAAEAQPGSVKGAARAQLLKFDRSKKDWSEVRAKYPQLFVAHLETLETVAECSEDKAKGSKICPPCRPAKDQSGLDGYMACLEKRLNCLPK